MRTRCASAFGLLVLSSLAACPPAADVKAGDVKSSMVATELPSDPAALIKIADEQIALGGAGYKNAQLAMEKALTNTEWANQKSGFEGHYRLARAVELASDRVEGHYFLAQLIGFSAQTQRGADIKPMLNQMVAESESAIKIDEKYDSGGPLRMLGTVYTRAPAPPVAIGDPEKGVQLLTRAVAASADHPLNQIYLAEAQVADERYQDAEATLQKARKLLSDARWNNKRSEWKEFLAKVERKLKAKQGQ